MSDAAPLAALAVLFGFAAVRELRPMADREGGSARLGFGARGRPLAAALRLGLPARLRRAGLESRFPLGAVLMAKL
ncbi:MAG TPA: hypothetical protein VN756_01655, partial [Solirubrobacterales bacterium]|nr:hypothetical protein [Solirubrobacterales bacterium]